MVNRMTLLAVLLCWLSPEAPARAAEENDYYRLVSVSVAETSTSSRAKNWKPAPDGLALEVSGLAFEKVKSGFWTASTTNRRRM